MSTVAALVETTRGHLMGFHKAQLNRLDGGLDASTATVVLEFTGEHIARGSIISIDDELMYVWDKAGLTCTVQRGHLGTTAATHSDNAVIEANPRFPASMIKAELKNEIQSWGQRIFATEELTLSVAAGERTVDLTGADSLFLHVIRCRRDAYSGEKAPRSVDFRLERTHGDYASGVGLVLDDPVSEASTLSVLIAKALDCSTFSNATNVVTTVGVPQTALDIPPLGAAWRLLATREVARTAIETAPEPRVAQDVPPGFITQAAQQLKRLRDERIGEEGRLLLHRMGTRFQ